MEVSVGTKIAARALRYYETDDRNPGSDAVIKLCRYFNISADWLLGLSDDRTIRNPVALSQQDDNNEVKP
jgi:transcriptional regulator with XRE-family HTH domain